MRICYLLLSPTFGMHQYTADYANRLARTGHEVHLVTTERCPTHRYLPLVKIHEPVQVRNTGFSRDGLRLWNVRRVRAALLACEPDVVHLTGPHLWNLPLLRGLRRAGVPVIHTLHDLDPHPGSPHRSLIRFWNRAVQHSVDHLLVHGQCYRQRLLEGGVDAQRVTATPLLHLFLGADWFEQLEQLAAGITYDPYVLFFGRLEHYKGVPQLIAAWSQLPEELRARMHLVLAGSGRLEKLWPGSLPAGIEVCNRLIQDEEALSLFQHCALLVLPYIGATQSALIPAAYFFRKAVVASPSGAFPEYVQEDETGWLAKPQPASSLATALILALSDFDRLARMGSAGRRWYDEQREREDGVLEAMYARVAEQGTALR